MTLQRDLIDLGFKENDAAVYVAVLELGEPGIGEIEKATGLHKQLIYLSAQRLEKEGLMSVHEIRGRRHFSVSNPSALEDKARAQLERTEQIVPLLFEKASKKRAAEDVRVYRGIAGVRHYYREVVRALPRNEVVRIIGIRSHQYYEIMPQDGPDFRFMEEMRMKNHLTWRLLLFSEAAVEAAFNEKRKLVELKVMSDPVAATNDIMIWHDRVGLLFYAEEPYVLDLAGPQTVQGFREYFDVLWKRGKIVHLRRQK